MAELELLLLVVFFYCKAETEYVRLKYRYFFGPVYLFTFK